MMDTIDMISGMFMDYFGVACDCVEPIAQSGGDRRYWRLSGGGYTAVGSFGPDADENRCFANLSRAFQRYDGFSPKIYAMSEDDLCYLQEDLGRETLFDRLKSPDFESDLKHTIRRLVELQKIPAEKWAGYCQSKPFSVRQVMWDLNYFKYEYLKPSGVTFDEDRLEDDFQQLAASLTGDDEFYGFMMRDCQSRNVMMTARGPVFIDFQGGRFGPVAYDAISLLWQSRAHLPEKMRMELLRYYAHIYNEGDQEKIGKMLASASSLMLFRTLQVLGAYGFRGLVQHRAHFVLSIPGALRNLGRLIADGVLNEYPELMRVCAILTEDARFQIPTSAGDHPKLRIEVFSFSYKKGYPDDYSGNGGGFMFDCRAMHNPGRYQQYKSLTGRDRAVVEFLEEKGEVRNFLRNVWALTDPAAERYIQRGFTHLQIGFGCTGGQHRSVYCAEKTASHLKKLFPEAEVTLLHREHPAG